MVLLYVYMLQVFLKFVCQYLLMVSWAMEKLWGTLNCSSFISYTGAAAKKFPDLFSFSFLFVLLVYRAQASPVGTDTKGRLYPMRGDLSPIGCPIPHPTTYRGWGKISESAVRWGLRFFHFLERNRMTK